jgi:peptide/nickel transport system permease protein
MFKIVFLWTDVVMWLLMAALGAYVWRIRTQAHLRARWKRVFMAGSTMSAAVVLGVLLAVAVADSFHFRRALPQQPGEARAYSPRVESVLDLLLAHQIKTREESYSAPLAYLGFVKQTLQRPAGASAPVAEAGPPKRDFPRLKFAGADLKDPKRQWRGDLSSRLTTGQIWGGGVAIAMWLLGAVAVGRHSGGWRNGLDRLINNETELPWRAALATASTLAVLVAIGVSLADGYHLFGTDRTGNDVLYQTLKSLRTAFVIASLSQLITLPVAVVMGVMAGYFGGWVDRTIEYVYTTISSVPDILLIAAAMLMVQVWLDSHSEVFETGLERADVKIFLLCVIVGVTSWAGLCRLLRAETLKLRELEFVQAARAFGVGPVRIMARHIAPNLFHLVLITSVLGFSSLILMEAVLSYVGIGVDPSMNSFGNMINAARGEMSREPAIWWPFAAAFVFMVGMVLAANLFADGVREAFDPRGLSWRAKRKPAKPAEAPAAVAQPEGSS